MNDLHQSDVQVVGIAIEDVSFKRHAINDEDCIHVDELADAKSSVLFSRSRENLSATATTKMRDSNPLKIDSDMRQGKSTTYEDKANQARSRVNGRKRRPSKDMIGVTEKINEMEAEKERAENRETEKLIEKVEREGKISYSHQEIPESFVKQLVTAMRNTKNAVEIRKFKMRNCGLNKNLQKIISSEMKPRKIRTLDLSGNKELDLCVVENIRNKMDSEVLDLSDTELGEKEIKELGNMKGIKELRLNYKAFTHGSITGALIKLINNGLMELSLIDSKITDKQLEKIAKRLNDDVSLSVLNLSHVTLKRTGVIATARIVNKSKQMNRLVISNCCLSANLLKTFEEQVKSKVLELDVSSNPDIKDGGIEVLASLSDKLHCVDLDISSNRLNGTDIKKLLVAEQPTKQVRKLCLAENSGIDPVVVGELAAKWKVEFLDISECRLSAKAMESLQISLGKHKLQCIDVSDPTGTISEEKRTALSQLSTKTQTLIFCNHQEWAEL